MFQRKMSPAKNNKKSALKIAVLSTNSGLYSTTRLVEAITAKGHIAKVIDYSKCYCVVGGDTPPAFYKEAPILDIDAVIPRIGASLTFYGCAVIRQFETQGVFTTVGSIALSRSRDKLRTLQVFSNKGIPFPRTAFAHHPSDIDYLIKEVGGAPLIIKLLEGTQGLGVVLAETKSAARSVIEAFYGLKKNIIVQEFIKEAKGMDIRAFVVGNKVVGAMCRTSLEGEFRSNLHRGGVGSTIELTQAETDLACAASVALGLPLCGVDMIRSNHGTMVIEVNSSPGLGGIEKATRLDIAGDIVSYIEANVKKRIKKDSIGV